MPEVIRGTGLSLTRLDACGRPIGDRMRIVDAANVEFVSDPESEPIDYSGGEVTADGLRWMTLEVTLCEPNPLYLYLVTGCRRFLGRPRPLAINGREYRRRRRSR